MGCRSTPISPQAHRLLQLTSSTTFDNNSVASSEADDALISASEVVLAALEPAKAALDYVNSLLKAAVENSAVPNQRDFERIARAFWDLAPLAEKAALTFHAASDVIMRYIDSQRLIEDAREFAFRYSQDAMGWREEAKNARTLSDQRNVVSHVTRLRQQRSGCGMTGLAIVSFVAAIVVAFS